MRVVFPQYLSDDAGRLLVCPVCGKAELLHSEQDTPVDGLQSVTDIGKGARDNDRHRVVDIGAPHLVFDVDGYDLFVHICHR